MNLGQKAVTAINSGNNSEEEEVSYSKAAMVNLKEKLSMNDVAAHAKFRRQKK